MTKGKAPRHRADAKGAGRVASVTEDVLPQDQAGSKSPFADHAAQGDAFDLKGMIPETWACIDCGINTFPGCSTRVEIERKYKTSAALKTLSATGEAPPLAELHFDETCEVYTVRDSVWRAAGMQPWGGCLCIGCLEKRLGRKLRPKDFPRRHEFNKMPGTDRLIERREAAR
jgi:hypothetical protein